jgi:hypothetical protein
MLLNRILRKVTALSGISAKLENIQLALGRIERRQIELQQSVVPQEWEFKVFSQWGEDGIIQSLINKVPISRSIFVEFGVEDYTESNTRFLLQNNYWSGLVIDGSESHIRNIKEQNIYWRYNLKAEQSFITKENINEIILSNGIKGDIGILSVDIDGNDYWVWQAISCINPRIVICEYNSLFGPTAKITIPYSEHFVRNQNGKPNTYYGASISALTHLANLRGYELVAGNSAGNNAFFVKKEWLSGINTITPADAFVKAQFKESRNPEGTLSFLSYEVAQQELAELRVVDVETGNEAPFKHYSIPLIS